MGIRESPERNSEKRMKIVAKLQILFKLIVSLCTSNGVVKCAEIIEAGFQNGEKERTELPHQRFHTCSFSTHGAQSGLKPY